MAVLQAYRLDRAVCPGHAVADRATLERWPCRRGGGQIPVTVGDDDLRVRADVDEQRDALLCLDVNRDEVCRRVGPHVAGDHRRSVNPALRVHRDAQAFRPRAQRRNVLAVHEAQVQALPAQFAVRLDLRG
jgi:hypothetical protein